MSINTIYSNLLREINRDGEIITTRSHEAKRHIFLPSVILDRFPMITYRPTAAMKAIREMEWFLSGESKCPDELLDWWDGQLSPHGKYIDGYSKQLRDYTSADEYGDYFCFDQIKSAIDQLRNHKNSRRIVLTTWNPGEMANITEANLNPNTPTCCHGTVIQFFVSGEALHMKTYQRSADMITGVPHNWEQYWAFLLYMAKQSGYKGGWIQWMFGDAHIYQEASHLEIMNAILNANDGYSTPENPTLEYNGNVGDAFKASDFTITKPEGMAESYVTTTRPKLL